MRAEAEADEGFIRVTFDQFNGRHLIKKWSQNHLNGWDSLKNTMAHQD